MVANGWATTWPKKALLAAGIEPTVYAIKAVTLWHKSTPTDPWSINPLGIPAMGYTRRTIPHTAYAMFNTYAEFSKAFAKAMSQERNGYIGVLLSTGESTAKLWREINALKWPAAETENDYPREIHSWIGDELIEGYKMPPKTPHRSTGTTDKSRLNNAQVIRAHKAMVTAVQSKLDLAKAITFITKGVK
jgi:hypothetical protein